MSQFVFKMPDLGEGTVEAEVIAWHTKPGDLIAEDQIMVEVMTDKAAIEVPSPVSGKVLSTTGSPGDKVAVGSPLIVIETAAAIAAAPAQPPLASIKAAPPAAAALTPAPANTVPANVPAAASASAAPAARIMASPANRRRAREAGIDLSTLSGSGPGGRILAGDLVKSGASARGTASLTQATTEIKVIGVRRIIAERMSEAKRTIPHFAYVEEVDVTELESLRQYLNSKLKLGEPALTYLPLVVLAVTRVLGDFPQCNVLYDAARGVLVRHAAVHMGIATQTPEGLKVPVVRNAEGRELSPLAAEIRRVTARARSGEASRDELRGSTITITSLGKLGGIASTPIINSPEVAIIGLNKAVDRPVVHQGVIAVRRIMNISSSFDHRFVDGYDAAAMIQALKERLEHPATLFIG